jgi:hypothetical protein
MCVSRSLLCVIRSLLCVSRSLLCVSRSLLLYCRVDNTIEYAVSFCVTDFNFTTHCSTYLTYVTTHKGTYERNSLTEHV